MKKTDLKKKENEEAKDIDVKKTKKTKEDECKDSIERVSKILILLTAAVFGLIIVSIMNFIVVTILS